MKQFADKEIIKALECCSTHTIECEECPLYCIGANCSSFELHRLTLDLINRQKAEIDTLKNVKKNTFLENAGLDVDLLAEIKSEAYKEFVERLKEKANHHFCRYGGQCYDIDAVEAKYIDDLLKEMVGEKL